MLEKLIKNNSITITRDWLSLENKNNCTLQSKLDGAVDPQLKLLISRDLQLCCKNRQICYIYMYPNWSTENLQVLHLKANQIYLFLNKIQPHSKFNKQECIISL